MTFKYNKKHPDRGRSNYRLRLSRRGLSKAPALEDVEVLRHRQERREERTGYPWWTGRADAEEISLAEAEGDNPRARALLNAIFAEVDYADSRPGLLWLA